MEPFGNSFPRATWLLHLEKILPSGDTGEIKGASLKERSLPALIKKRLLNEREEFQPQKAFGRSPVTWYPEKYPSFYFKKYPELSGYEYWPSPLWKNSALKACLIVNS